MDLFTSSVFNYSGHKGKLVKVLLPLIPHKITNYIELFGGSYVLGLNVEADRHVYNDKCVQVAKLINTIKTYDTEELIKSVERIIEEYKLPTKSKGHTDDHVESYNKLRSTYNTCINSKDCNTDLMFYVLLCYSFNNLISFNSKGEFNVPMGKNRHVFNSSLKDKLIKFSNRIKEIDLLVKSSEFDQVMKLDRISRDSFVYVDPPYILSSDSYSRTKSIRWTEDHEVKLYAYLDELNVRGIKFILSNITDQKGKENTLLKKWMTKYNALYVKSDYSNCSYQRLDREGLDVEVLVMNY